MLPIIRNDDIGFSTDINEIYKFCEICDKYGFKIIQAITLIGHTIDIDSGWDNDKIFDYSCTGQTFKDNTEVFDFLLNRDDFIGTHGFRHTHRPTKKDQQTCCEILHVWGFAPTYAVLPFNEQSEEYDDRVCGLKVLGKSQRLEDYLEGMSMYGQTPTDPIIYCHSWRFKDGNQFGYSWEKLDACLRTISTTLK